MGTVHMWLNTMEKWMQYSNNAFGGNKYIINTHRHCDEVARAMMKEEYVWWLGWSWMI